MTYFDGKTQVGYLGRALEAEERAKRGRHRFGEGDPVLVPGGREGKVIHVDGYVCIVEIRGVQPFQRFHVLQLKAAA